MFRKILLLTTFFVFGTYLLMILFLPSPLVFIKTNKESLDVGEKINAEAFIINLRPVKVYGHDHGHCNKPEFLLNQKSIPPENFIAPCPIGFGRNTNTFYYSPWKLINIKKTFRISEPGEYSLSVENLDKKKMISVKTK